jgi:hypothetical protein
LKKASWGLVLLPIAGILINQFLMFWEGNEKILISVIFWIILYELEVDSKFKIRVGNEYEWDLKLYYKPKWWHHEDK